MEQDFELEYFLNVLPDAVKESLLRLERFDDLYEVVLDLGRPPEARFKDSTYQLSETPVSFFDLEFVISRTGSFDRDNRAGIERTLHRISAIMNRRGRIVGLTCRYGRSIQGVIDTVKDYFSSGKSVLLLGKPGVGKTTLLREAARIMSVEMKKRVIVVDTSNEIAGDGDIPHVGIGNARRMQVPTGVEQHTIMIQAVENHMPEVIIIDELGTEEEATACRTIAERGVQLVGTAHGNSLPNLLINPTLSDLLGGVNSVILSDEEAFRRGTQKTVLERTSPPTFQILIEIRDRGSFAIYKDIATTVDKYLREHKLFPETRVRDTDGITIKTEEQLQESEKKTEPLEEFFKIQGEPYEKIEDSAVVSIYPFGVSRDYLERAAKSLHIRVNISRRLSESDIVLTTHSYESKKPQTILEAKSLEIPIYTIPQNSLSQIKRFLRSIKDSHPEESVDQSTLEEAVETVLRENQSIKLPPAPSRVRKYQHKFAERFGLPSSSIGEEPNRSVVIHPPQFKED